MKQAKHELLNYQQMELKIYIIILDFPMEQLWAAIFLTQMEQKDLEQ